MKVYVTYVSCCKQLVKNAGFITLLSGDVTAEVEVQAVLDDGDNPHFLRLPSFQLTLHYSHSTECSPPESLRLNLPPFTSYLHTRLTHRCPSPLPLPSPRLSPFICSVQVSFQSAPVYLAQGQAQAPDLPGSLGVAVV